MTFRNIGIVVVLATSLCVLVAIRTSAETRNITVAVKDAKGQTVGGYAGSFALLVGVSDYTAGWPSLPSVPGELAKVETALMSQGFSVTKVLNPDAQKLQGTIWQFISEYGYNSDNRLLFFFSGHGYTLDNNRRGYLVPADAPDPRKDETNFRRKALDMTQLLAWSRQMTARHALFLFDSCFSGTIFKTKALPGTPPQITTMTALPVRQFITAGDAGQEVPANSVFTPAFVDALTYGAGDLNKDGYISGMELGLYLQGLVPRHARQTPQFGKIDDYELSRGDFVFVAGGSAVVVTDDGDKTPGSPPAAASGKLKVDTIPSGAKILVDGEDKGQSPVYLKDLPSGEVLVQAELEGYPAQEKVATIAAGKVTQITLLLEKAAVMGRLYVKPDPADASVKVLNIGTRYQDGMELSAGRYHVEVSKSGFEPQRQWVDLAAGQDLEVTVALKESAAPAATASTPVASEESGGKTWREPTTGMEFVWVPGGCYQMGSNDGEPDEKPVHEVCVDGYWLGKYEVTQEQWERVMRSNPSRFKKGGNYPVEKVSWYDTQDFIKRLDAGGKKLRLPTEAEWEYACRSGGRDETYSGGNSADQVAWYESNSVGSTHAVGTKSANGLGLYDLSGNVWEWVEDIYSDTAYSAHGRSNPIYTGGGSNRVYRGGNWYGKPVSVRCASRDRSEPGSRNYGLGFRLARTP